MMKNSPLSFLITLVFSVLLIGATKAQSLITATINTPGNSQVLSEECDGPYQLVIYRASDVTDTITITLTSTGEATLGVDFNFLPGTFPLVMLPDVDSVIIPISVVNDGLPEGISNGEESLILNLTASDGSTVSTFVLEGHAIADRYFINFSHSGDTITTCEFGISTLFVEPGFTWESAGAAFFNPPIVTEPGWYYLQVGSDTCGAKDSVYVDLLYGHINEDTLYICDDGSGVTILTTITGDPISFQWIPSDSTLSDPNSLTPLATPTVTTTYILEVVFAECTSRDTVVVRVDSLPDDLHIDIAPQKPYYCAGEIVALFSPSFDSLAYPDLEFLWRPNDGTFLSDTSLLNAALQLQDTTLYIRTNTNNACMSEDSIMIDVVPSGVPLTVTDTTLCPGASFQVAVLSNQVTEPEWTPEDGLSCTMCLSPTVTVTGTPGTTQVYMFSGKIKECPVGATLSITIPPIQEINIAGDQIVCGGDIVPLTITNPAGLSGFEWDVQGGNATLSCNDCPNPMVTVGGNETVTLVVTANTTDTAYCGALGIIQLAHGIDAVINGDPIGACEGGTAVAFPGTEEIENVIWVVEEGNLSLSCSACRNPTVTVEGPGRLRYTGRSTHPDTCSITGTVEVTIDVNQITLPDIRLCIDNTVSLSTGLANIDEITWTRLTGDMTLSCNNCPEPVVTLHGAGGTIRFEGFISSPDICFFEGTVDIIAETGMDVITWETDPDSMDIHQGQQVTVTFNSLGAPPTNISWIVNGVGVGGNTNAITFNANEEINIVTATFINTFGCTQVAIDTILALPPMYQIPNAFTPNGDDKNDRFRVIVMGDITVETFRVFNRWGQLVYDAPPNDLEGWDGNFKGEPASSDTYVYMAKIRTPSRTEIVEGDVMLLR
jgi:gliding motility-associated-like protein